ncbi:MAG: VanZ family protein [Balneolaceae bacterium]|nr:VanZ family protein [Balneolaceae bacterium]
MRETVKQIVAEYPFLLPAGTLLLTAAVLFLTLSPADLIGGQSLGSYDKTGHVIMFGSWTYLFGLYRYVSQPDKPSLFTIFLVGVLFGISVEVLQFLLPFERSADLFDIAFDAIGAFIAILVLRKSVSNELPFSST